MQGINASDYERLIGKIYGLSPKASPGVVKGLFRDMEEAMAGYEAAQAGQIQNGPELVAMQEKLWKCMNEVAVFLCEALQHLGNSQRQHLSLSQKIRIESHCINLSVDPNPETIREAISSSLQIIDGIDSLSTFPELAPEP